jgi:hypothetical protein
MESPKLFKELTDFLKRHPFLIATLYGVSYNVETRWYADGRVETEKKPKPAIGPIPDKYLWELCHLGSSNVPIAEMSSRLSKKSRLLSAIMELVRATMNLSRRG